MLAQTMFLLKLSVKALACCAVVILAANSFAQTLTAISITPQNIVGGTSAIGTVKLSKAVTGAEFAVNLSSDKPFVSVPATTYIGGGTKAGTFPVTTSPVTSTSTATITATANGLQKKITVTVEAPVLSSISLTPKTLAGGESSVATVALTGSAPTGGIAVSIKSSKAIASVPSTLIIPAGSTSVTFPVSTSGVSSQSIVTISAMVRKAIKTATLTVIPTTLAGISLTPSTVVGGNSTGVRVYLNGVAPLGGFTVALSSSNPAAANVLSQLSIPAGSSTAGFLLTTNSVSADTSVLIAAEAKGAGVSKTLKVLASNVVSLSVSPGSVIGGNPATGTITLSEAAPQGGAIVTLSSNSGSVLVPATLEVVPGSTTAAFTLNTQAVSNNTISTITARIGGSSRSASLTISPGTALANSAWPKFHANSANTAIGLGKGATGKMIWSFQTQSQVGASSPTIGADGTVYVGSWDNSLYAINHDGSLKWSFPTGDYIFSTPTLAANGTIYLSSTDGDLYALNPNGSLAWRFQTAEFGNSSPALAEDGTIYLGSYDNYFYAINPNGKLKWKYYIGNQSDSSPAIGVDGTIYVGCNDGILYALNPNGTLQWAFFTGSVITAAPAIGADGTIYIASQDQNLYAIVPSGIMKWAFQTQDQIWSSPAIGPLGTIYVASRDSDLYAVNPDGSLKWQFATGAEIRNSSPAVGSDGTIYFGSRDGFVYAVTAAGSLSWKYATNNWIDSSPSIAADGTIYIGSNSGYIYAIH